MNRTRKTGAKILWALVGAAAVIACEPLPPDADDNPADDTQSEIPEILAEGSIDAKSGGTLEVTDVPGYNGTRVIVPPGALEKDTVISIVAYGGPASNTSFDAVAAGPAIEFKPSGLKFSKPVAIYLPYDLELLRPALLTERQAFVHYYRSEADSWDAQLRFDTDPRSKTVAALTDHFSVYQNYGLKSVPDNLVVHELVLDSTQVYLRPGDDLELIATAYSAAGEVLDVPAVIWSNSYPDVAAVDDGGLVLALDYGSTTITARIDGAEDTAYLDVVDHIPAGDAPVLEYAFMYFGAGEVLYCDYYYESECTDPNKVYVFKDRLKAGDVQLEIWGTDLLASGGVNDPDNPVQVTVSGYDGYLTVSGEFYDDGWSVRDTLVINIPASASSGMLTVQTPGGQLEFEFVVWAGPVVTGIQQGTLSPCDVAAGTASVMLYGHNLVEGSARQVEVGGLSVTISDMVDDDFYEDQLAVVLAPGTGAGHVEVSSSAGSSVDWESYYWPWSSYGADLEVYDGPVIRTLAPYVVTDQTQIRLTGCGWGATYAAQLTYAVTVQDGWDGGYYLEADSYAVTTTGNNQTAYFAPLDDLTFAQVANYGAGVSSAYVVIPRAERTLWRATNETELPFMSLSDGTDVIVGTVDIAHCSEGCTDNYFYRVATDSVMAFDSTDPEIVTNFGYRPVRVGHSVVIDIAYDQNQLDWVLRAYYFDFGAQAITYETLVDSGPLEDYQYVEFVADATLLYWLIRHEVVRDYQSTFSYSLHRMHLGEIGGEDLGTVDAWDVDLALDADNLYALVTPNGDTHPLPPNQLMRLAHAAVSWQQAEEVTGFALSPDYTDWTPRSLQRNEQSSEVFLDAVQIKSRPSYYTLNVTESVVRLSGAAQVLQSNEAQIDEDQYDYDQILYADTSTALYDFWAGQEDPPGPWVYALTQYQNGEKIPVWGVLEPEWLSELLPRLVVPLGTGQAYWYSRTVQDPMANDFGVRLEGTALYYKP